MAFSNVIPSSQPRTRRVFFSFHFQNDIWRVNQVRQSWRYNNPNSQLCRYSNDDLGFRDASIWERAKREGVLSMKRLIDARIKNTSVTCILAEAKRMHDVGFGMRLSRALSMETHCSLFT